MDLPDFDEKRVRLTDVDGLVFTGEATFNSADFTEYEIGDRVCSLSIDHWLFRASEIDEVRLLSPDEPRLWMSCPLHEMRLAQKPFDQIFYGTKTVEMRLYDEKRRRVKPGDVIRFACDCFDGDDILFVRVKSVDVFPDFASLYRAFPKSALGYAPDEAADPDDMLRYYSAQAQKTFGVVAIGVELL